LSRVFKASVKENRRLTTTHYLITLKPLQRIKKARPGQFFMLSVNRNFDPFLRRPLSFYRQQGQDIQFIYKVVGKGTNILSQKKTGDILEVLGPLGNGFPIIKKTRNKIILVAGGLGIASVFALAETIARKNPLLFYGARTKKEALCINELKSLGINPIISTDDGSLGQKGMIIDILDDFLTSHFSPLTLHLLYACGPKPMLQELSRLAEKYKLKGYIALEENMACGFGVCLGCAVKTKYGFKLVCKEGPIFPIEEIVW
jgi:dihydroorotate dehydrogenase electron transfer subunit